MPERPFPKTMRCRRCRKEKQPSVVRYYSGMWSGEPSGGYYGSNGQWIESRWHWRDSAWFKCSHGHEIRLVSKQGGEWKREESSDG